MLGYGLAGLVVGFLVGATGVGGGSVMSPVLITVFGLSPAVAVGTDLLFAAGTKGFATLLHGVRGSVDWRVVVLLAGGSLPATLATLIWLRYADVARDHQHVIVIVLGFTITATGLLMLLRRPLQRWARRGEPSPARSLLMRWRAPLTVVAGGVIGALVTISSVGGGVIGTMILFLLYPGMPAVSIVGTDLAHAVLLTGVAGVGHLTLGTPNLGILLALLMGSLPGIYLGTRVGFRLPDHALRPVIAGLLVVAGMGLFV